MRTLAVGLAVSCLFGVTLAAAEDPPAVGAPGVAEMLQRRHESQLREQLAKDGRWDEIQRMDEEQLRRRQIFKKQTITRLNAELAREGSVDTPANGDGVVTVCGPLRSPATTDSARVKADAKGTEISFVR